MHLTPSSLFLSLTFTLNVLAGAIDLQAKYILKLIKFISKVFVVGKNRACLSRRNSDFLCHFWLNLSSILVFGRQRNTFIPKQKLCLSPNYRFKLIGIHILFRLHVMQRQWVFSLRLKNRTLFFNLRPFLVSRAILSIIHFHPGRKSKG